MFKRILVFAFFATFAVQAFPQNLTTVSGSNITDINGTKLAAGQVCFLITDQSDNPISVSIGGGGQALKRGYCSAVTAGVITGFTVPNPAATSPSGIYYRVTVKDSSTGQEVLRYALVSFTGATFNFDNYAPMNLAQGAPLTGNSVTGNLSVTGNIAATGTVTGSNIAGGQIATGVGTTNKLPKYTNGASAVIGDSSISDNGTTVSTTEALSAASLATTGAATVGTTLGVTGASALANVVLNGANTLTGAALTTGGTTSTTGGLSAFVGAPGSATERLSVVPADGSTAATRVGSLSVRIVSGGFLTGSQVAGISSAGVLSLSTSTGTLPATIANDTAGGITFANNAGGSFQFGNGGTIFMNVLGGGIRWSGATSGTTVVQAAATAGSGTLTLPGGVNDTLIGKNTTDLLTGKSFGTGIAQGSGFKHQRFGTLCTTAAAAGGSCTTAVTWTSAFADANYTVSCTGVTATNAPVLTVESIAAAGFTVRIFAVVASAATFALADCIAAHD